MFKQDQDQSGNILSSTTEMPQLFFNTLLINFYITVHFTLCDFLLQLITLYQQANIISTPGALGAGTSYFSTGIQCNMKLMVV